MLMHIHQNAGQNHYSLQNYGEVKIFENSGKKFTYMHKEE
jgi:hypothetical protein